MFDRARSVILFPCQRANVRILHPLRDIVLGDHDEIAPVVALGASVAVGQTHRDVDELGSQRNQAGIDGALVNAAFGDCLQSLRVGVTSEQAQRCGIAVVVGCVECLIDAAQTGVVDGADQIQVVAALGKVLPAADAVVGGAAHIGDDPLDGCLAQFIDGILVSLLTDDQEAPPGG